jgi:hypothetical protein
LKFNELIFNLFSLNIHRYPTLPSLAFAIFRSKYLKHQIPLIKGEMYHDLRRSFTGGAVDVYRPFGRNIKGYDVNSLYPTQMKQYPFPVGKITYFEGDITKINPSPFGFFEVDIIALKNLFVPILQTRVKTPTGEITMAPLGT